MSAIETTSLGDRWPNLRLRWVLEKLSRPVPDGAGVVTAFRDGQVTLRSRRRIDGYTEAIQELGYQGVYEGDLVISSMDAFAGSLGVSDSTGKCSPVYDVYRPRHGADARFYAYYLRHLAWSGFIQSLAKGIRERSTAFDASVASDLLLPNPPVGEQQAIADYLDAETSRIDGLVAARRSMLGLFSERLDGAVSALLDRPDWPTVALKWRTQLTVGIVIRPSELYVASGAPCLRGFNVRPGAVNASDLAYISPEGNAANAKSMLREGDVVVVRTGNAGAAAVVPDWAVGGNCVDLLLIRRSDVIDPRFLEAVLNSAVVRRQIDEGSVGALQAHFNTEALANLRVPVPPMAAQRRAIAELDAVRAQASKVMSALTRQIDLLLERRQALITAAVTGRLGIPGIAA